MKFDNDIISNDYEKIIKILSPIAHSRTGSSYIEEPPKLTTDIDHLILVHELKPATKIIRKNGWNDCTSNDDEYNQERKMNNNWLAFRKNEFNIIVMDDIVLYINFMAATELLKKYNVKDKDLRIDVMRSIKFNQFENSLYVFIKKYLNKELT